MIEMTMMNGIVFVLSCCETMLNQFVMNICNYIREKTIDSVLIVIDDKQSINHRLLENKI